MPDDSPKNKSASEETSTMPAEDNLPPTKTKMPPEETQLMDEGDIPSVSVTSRTEVIDRYKLVKELGQGGFGVVWQAEQTEPIRRDVALKIIKLGMDSAEIIARFEVERQSLAMMDHPNIASVLDAGTTVKGRPYFVMELVKGVPITEYCDARQLTIRQRLEIFIPVCQAVQHAHQKAILHRDLKPSNILVTEVDGKPTPKVIDFGIAKALGTGGESDLRDHFALTREGAVIGTPQYMSPEQAGAHPDLDTRSDIYSLGIILFELLTGSTPLSRERLRGAVLDEVLRLIREADHVRPSSRVVPVTDAVRRTSEARGTEPAKLPRYLRGDLDWITLKALEKERDRRYDTVNSLVADIISHLNDKPVTACPPGATYRLRKLIRRNRTAFRAMGGVLAALGMGFGIAAWRYGDDEKNFLEFARVIGDAQQAKSSPAARHMHLQRAEESFAAGDSSVGLAYLAHAFRLDPKDQATAARLVSALRDRSHMSVMAVPWQSPGADIFGWAADGKSVLLSADGQLLRWRLEEWRKKPEPLLASRFANRLAGCSLNSAATRAATFPQPGVCQVIDLQNGKPLTEFLYRAEPEPAANPWPAAGPVALFSPDERWLLVIEPMRNATIWDARSGALVAKLPADSSAATFHPDGRTLAVGRRDGSVQLREVDGKDWKIRQEWRTDEGFIQTLTFVSDRLMVHGARDRLSAYPYSEGQVQEAISFGPCRQYDVSLLGDVVAIVRPTDKVALLSLRDGSPVMSEIDAREEVSAVSLSPNGIHLMVATDTRVGVWSRSGLGLITRSQRLVSPLGKNPVGRSKSAQFSPDGRWIILAQQDGTISLWSVESTRNLPLVFPMRSEASLVALHPQGRFLAAGNAEGEVSVWDLKNGFSNTPPIFGVKKETPSSVCFAFEPGSERLWICSDGSTLQPWHWPSGRQEGDGFKTAGGVSRLEFSDDGKKLFVGSGRDSIFKIPELVEISGGWSTRGSSSSVFIRHGLTLLQMAEGGSGIQRWEVDSGQAGAPVFASDSKVEKYFPTENGETCAVVYADKAVQVWDTRSGSAVGPKIRHQLPVAYASLHLPSDIIVTASDNAARLWQISTGKAVGNQMSHRDDIRHASLSPDGRRLATTSIDRILRIWEVPTGRALTEEISLTGIPANCQWHPNGNQVITTGPGFAECWTLPAIREEAPLWLGEWAEAVGGLRINDQGSLAALPLESEARFREKAKSRMVDDYYTRTLRWFYTGPDERGIAPDSEIMPWHLAVALCQPDELLKSYQAFDLAPDSPWPWVNTWWPHFAKSGEGPGPNFTTLVEMAVKNGKTRAGEAAAAHILEAMFHSKSDVQRSISALRAALKIQISPLWNRRVKTHLARLLAANGEHEEAAKLLQSVPGA